MSGANCPQSWKGFLPSHSVLMGRLPEPVSEPVFEPEIFDEDHVRRLTIFLDRDPVDDARGFLQSILNRFRDLSSAVEIKLVDPATCDRPSIDAQIEEQTGEIFCLILSAQIRRAWFQSPSEWKSAVGKLHRSDQYQWVALFTPEEVIKNPKLEKLVWDSLERLHIELSQ